MHKPGVPQAGPYGPRKLTHLGWTEAVGLGQTNQSNAAFNIQNFRYTCSPNRYVWAWLYHWLSD